MRPLAQLVVDSLIIVVEALDECDTGSSVGHVLKLLADTEDLDRRHIRIVITSRPDMSIQGSFMQLSDGNYQGIVLHDISDNVDDDIRRFLEHQLKHIRLKEQDFVYGIYIVRLRKAIKICTLEVVCLLLLGCISCGSVREGSFLSNGCTHFLWAILFHRTVISIGSI